MEKSVIYGLSCRCHPNQGVRYIGQTRRGLEKRLYEHLWDSGPSRKREVDYNLPSHNWVRKHGAENIIGEVVEYVEPGKLDEREIYWIAEFRQKGHDLLNLHPGGNSRAGWTHSEDVRKVISAATRRRIGGNRTIYDLTVVPRIRESIKSGSTYQSISQEFGVGYSVVSEIARGVSYAKVDDSGQFNPDLPVKRESIANGHGSHRKIDDTDRVRDLVERGAPYSEIADEFGVTSEAIANHVFRNGLPKRRQQITEDLRDRIVEMYLQNPALSLRAIGREVGRTHTVVRKVLSERGVR